MKRGKKGSLKTGNRQIFLNNILVRTNSTTNKKMRKEVLKTIAELKNKIFSESLFVGQFE